MVNDAVKPPLVALYRGYKEVDRRRQDFKQWREERPFWGGIFLAVGGMTAGYTPFQVLTSWLFREGQAQIIGIMGSFFATAVILAGLGVLVNPELSNLLGMVGITFTILATLVGNFGGLLIGTFLGIIGGALCIAWRRVDIYDRPRSPRSERRNVPRAEQRGPHDDDASDATAAERAAEDARDKGR